MDCFAVGILACRLGQCFCGYAAKVATGDPHPYRGFPMCRAAAQSSAFGALMILTFSNDRTHARSRSVSAVVFSVYHGNPLKGCF